MTENSNLSVLQIKQRREKLLLGDTKEKRYTPKISEFAVWQ